MLKDLCCTLYSPRVSGAVKWRKSGVSLLSELLFRRDRSSRILKCGNAQQEMLLGLKKALKKWFGGNGERGRKLINAAEVKDDSP